MGRKKTKKEITIHSNETKILIGLLILLLGISLTVAPFVAEATILNVFTNLLGKASLVWGITILVLAGRLLTKIKYLQKNRTLLGFAILSIGASLFFTFWAPREDLQESVNLFNYGGSIGKAFHLTLQGAVGSLIEFLIILTLFIVGFTIISGSNLESISDALNTLLEKIATKPDKAGSSEDLEITDSGTAPDTVENPLEKRKGLFRKFIGGEDDLDEDIAVQSIDDQPHVPKEDPHKFEDVDQQTSFVDGGNNVEQPSSTNGEGEDDPGLTGAPKYTNWEFPTTDILMEPIKKPQDKEIHKRNAILIEKTLRSFDIESKISKITIGPTVVQYALRIAEGIKVSKVKNHTSDLALALATSESQIRIEAPIPGSSLIGIEIPNPTPNFVYIRDLIEEIRATDEHYELPLALGKNVSGKSYIKDLTLMPHLLVAGATGTGKSVGVNSILTGLLMTKTPDQLRLILVDPKMVEMAPYNGIPHLLIPVVTDMELVANALQWAVEEMNSRYRLLKQVGVKNIVQYNKRTTETSMPYIVIVIDEMADLMQTKGVEVEGHILRLAQMARAVGIHLILATQRPSVNIITGVIKANVPGRMAFSVSTQVDSKVILDQSGAEALIGRGDMLIKTPELIRPVRLQGAYTDNADTEQLVQFLKDQADGEIYQEEIVNPQPKITSGGRITGLSDLSDDDLFEDALEIVINSKKGSASMLQRRLKIGYNRAARIIDQMYELGIVGAQEGSNPRDVLIMSKEELVNKLKGGSDPAAE